MKIPQEIRKLIESGHPTHLVTLNRDGSSQATRVWIGVDGDEVVAGTWTGHPVYDLSVA